MAVVRRPIKLPVNGTPLPNPQPAPPQPPKCVEADDNPFKLRGRKGIHERWYVTEPRYRKVGKYDTGRPTLYREDYHPDQVYEYRLYGLTNEEIAERFEVSTTSLQRWRENHIEFKRAWIAGGIDADAYAARQLYRRGIGYTHVETKAHYDKDKGWQLIDMLKHHPPDVGALTIWMSNRSKGLKNPWKPPAEVGSVPGASGAALPNITINIVPVPTEAPPPEKSTVKTIEGKADPV